MQHPGGTCVALPNVDACPQLSCAALTFMYLQQVSLYYCKDTNLHLVHVLFVSSWPGEVEWNWRTACFSTRRAEWETHCVQFVAVWEAPRPADPC